MKIFGTLERAQAEPLSADPTGTGLITGRFFYNSTGNDFKYYNGAVRTVVNLDEAQTFSNKTLSGNIAANLSPDGVETLTFPVATDTLATLTQTETLENKSLPVATFPHQTTPSVPASGNIKVYSKNDDKLYVLDENGNESSIGSGGGGALNFYEKGDADLSQVGDHSQGSDPTFGNGGVSSSTFALTTSNPARGTKSFQMTLNGTPSASNNDYVRSELIPIPLGYRGQFLTVVAKYNYDGLDDDIKLVVRDETNSVLITDTTEKFKKYVNADGYTEISFVVYVAQSCENLSVGPQVVSHATGGEVLKWDDVIVTPDLSRSKEVVKTSEWEPFAANGTWTNVAYAGFKRRVGDTIEMIYYVHCSSGAPTGTSNLRFDYPDGVQPDVSKMGSVNVRAPLGMIEIRDAGGLHYNGQVRGNDLDSCECMWQGGSDPTSNVSHASPILFANDDSIIARVSFPVIGWEVYEENVLTTANVGDVGSIQAFGGTGTPDGFLYCDGQSLRRDEYPDLFAAIGTAYGTVDGDHFNAPDLRGQFLRGQSDGTGVDPDAGSRVVSKAGGNSGDNVGSYQGYTVQSHAHTINTVFTGFAGGGATTYMQRQDVGNPSVVTQDNAFGGNETRPENIYVRYYIRYRSSVTTAALPKAFAGIVGDVKHSLLTEAQFQTYAGEGWVLMDGRSVVGSAYEALTTNSNIPDARGRALRMKDNGASVNPDGELALGANQEDEFESHTHTHTTYTGSTGAVGGGQIWVGYQSVATGASGGNETRMKNTTVNFFVKIN